MSDHPTSTPPNAEPPSEQDAAQSAAHNTFAFAAGNPLEPPLSSPTYMPDSETVEQTDEANNRDEFESLPFAEAEITRTLDDTAWMDMREASRVSSAKANAEVERVHIASSLDEDMSVDRVEDGGEARDDAGLTYENWTQTLEPESLDLDELLASVSTYSGITYALNDGEDADTAEDDAEQPARRGSSPTGEIFTPAPCSPAIRLPAFTRLRRGSIGAIIPAFGLIALGAWMTLTLTGGGTLDNRLVALAVIAIIVFSLLAQWLGSGRWARGSLFLALLLLGTAALIAFSLQPGGLDLLRAYPLLFGILGLALVGTGTLGRPGIRRVVLPGFLLLIVAAIGLAYNLGYIPSAAITPALPLWPGLAGLIVLLLLLPLLSALPRRRRSPDARTDMPRASGARVRS